MKNFALFFLLALSPLFADSNPALPPNPYDAQGGKRSPTFSKANAQAIYWINLIDQHQYGASWLEAANLIKDITSRDQWAAAMHVTRGDLGPVSSRKVQSHQAVNMLPGGTRGNFVVIHYQTNFQRKPNAKESITLMSEGNLGLWKVVRYTIDDR